MKNVSGSSPHKAANEKHGIASLKYLSKAATLVLATSFMVGCGGGSGGGQPAMDAPQIVVIPPAPDDTINNVDDVDVVDVEDVVAETSLTQLFGRVLFGHSFFNDETLFFYDGVYGLDDLVGDTADDLTLVDSFDFIRRDTPDSEFAFIEIRNLGCSLVDNVDIFLCSVFLDEGASAHFLFDALVNNESSGDFTFCTGDQNAIDGACVDELLDNPDGSVLVTVDPQVTVAGIELTQLNAAKNTFFNTSSVPYFEYENQATVRSSFKQSSDDSEASAHIANAFENLKLTAASHD